ncbi:MAG: NAD(P)-dependent oxidoreductase [Phenylobacterium zucineum]|nr:MAG: NAD(P)-dependent oxidoreductase [Phenylobacterium zucineum]
MPPRLFIFGYGFSARALTRLLQPQGWIISGSYRTSAQPLRDDGVIPVAVGDQAALDTALAEATAVLITAPPTAEGCPALPLIVPSLRRTSSAPPWLGYLSTTGVYGDRGGGWVFEDSRLAAQSMEGTRRVAAERDWLEIGRHMDLTVTVHRLPGIYGKGRSTLDRLRAGNARRLMAPGQVFSRIHVDDLARGLMASMSRPRAWGIYNLCDDWPAPNSEVVTYAADLLGINPPPEEVLDLTALRPQARRFYGESKRVSNARAKGELGWRPVYPTYREGLTAILAAGG